MAGASVPGVAAARYSISTVGARIGAAIVDSVYIMLLIMAQSLLSTFLLRGVLGQSFLLRYVLPPLLITGLYYVVYTWKTGATPGKKKMGLVVRDMGGNPIDLRRSVIRYVAHIALGYLFVTPLVILFNRQRRSIPDFIAGTIVLRDPSMQVQRRSFAFAMVIYILPFLYLAKIGGEVLLSKRKPVSERLMSDNIFVQLFASTKIDKLSLEEKRAVVKDLEQPLASDDKTVRWRALESAGKLGENAKPLAQKIVGLLASQESSVTREKAAEALGGIGPSVIPQLRRLLFVKERPVDKKVYGVTPDWKMKQLGALSALEHMGVPGVSLLSDICRGKDLGIRDEATAALAKITGRESDSAIRSCTNYVPELYYHARSEKECAKAWGSAVSNYPVGRHLKYSMSQFVFGKLHDSYTYSSKVVESTPEEVKVEIQNIGTSKLNNKKPSWTKEIRKGTWQHQCEKARIIGNTMAGYADSWTPVAGGPNFEYPTLHRAGPISKIEATDCLVAGKSLPCKHIEMGDQSGMREIWFSAGSDPFVIKMVDKHWDQRTSSLEMGRSQELIEYER